MWSLWLICSASSQYLLLLSHLQYFMGVGGILCDFVIGGLFLGEKSWIRLFFTMNSTNKMVIYIYIYTHTYKDCVFIQEEDLPLRFISFVYLSSQLVLYLSHLILYVSIRYHNSSSSLSLTVFMVEQFFYSSSHRKCFHTSSDWNIFNVNIFNINKKKLYIFFVWTVKVYTDQPMCSNFNE